MEDIAMGEMIRSLRKAKGMTQEALAEGICSVSSLSKIENGSQAPARSTFRKFMERLGEPGFFYGEFFASPLDSKWEQLRYELLDDLEYQDIEKAEEKLWVLMQLTQANDAGKEQFFAMAKLLWQRSCGIQFSDYAGRCADILRMSRPGYRDAGQILSLEPTRDEMLVCNNLALGYLWDDSPITAIQILLQLLIRLQKNTYGAPIYWKQKAVLCNNVAICFLALDQLREAESFCDRGNRSLQRCGGVNVALHLLRTRMELSERGGETDAYLQLRMFLANIYTMAGMGAVYGRDVDGFLRMPRGLTIF